MVYIGAKVWGKSPFFGDSIFLFLMYDVWLRCVCCDYTLLVAGLRCVLTLQAASLHMHEINGCIYKIERDK